MSPADEHRKPDSAGECGRWAKRKMKSAFFPAIIERNQGKRSPMNYYLNYEGKRISFSLPAEWNVLSSQDCAKAPLVEDVAKEIERALDNPIGTPPLEKLARSGMKAAVL